MGIAAGVFFEIRSHLLLRVEGSFYTGSRGYECKAIHFFADENTPPYTLRAQKQESLGFWCQPTTKAKEREKQ